MKKRGNGKTPFIVIDHIGKVKPRDPKLSPDRISGEVTVELKSLADEARASVLILNQRNGGGSKRDNPRPISADLYGGEGARADYDAVITLYRPEKYKAEREAVAARPSDWATINRVFGSEIEGIAEIAAIKVRFGDPTIRERLEIRGPLHPLHLNAARTTGGVVLMLLPTPSNQNQDYSHMIEPLIVDSFAGGGGASTGIEMALGRSPDIAINHNADALALHAANHPETVHLSENIFKVDPLDRRRKTCRPGLVLTRLQTFQQGQGRQACRAQYP